MRMLSLYKPFALMILLFWALGFGRAQAQTPDGKADLTTIEQIRAAVLKHVQGSVSSEARIDVGALDARLRLGSCPTPLSTRTASEAGNGASLSVEVRCETAGWKLFVPVTLSWKVPVVVARRGLSRGDVLGAADYEVQMRDRATQGGAYLGSSESVEGRVLARALPAGAAITLSALAPAHLVKRGQSVTLIGESGGFQVRAQGKALADAAAGQLIRVENLSSRRVVEGQVGADGTIRIRL